MLLLCMHGICSRWISSINSIFRMKSVSSVNNEVCVVECVICSLNLRYIIRSNVLLQQPQPYARQRYLSAGGDIRGSSSSDSSTGERCGENKPLLAKEKENVDPIDAAKLFRKLQSQVNISFELWYGSLNHTEGKHLVWVSTCSLLARSFGWAMVTPCQELWLSNIHLWPGQCCKMVQPCVFPREGGMFCRRRVGGNPDIRGSKACGTCTQLSRAMPPLMIRHSVVLNALYSFTLIFSKTYGGDGARLLWDSPTTPFPRRQPPGEVQFLLTLRLLSSPDLKVGAVLCPVGLWGTCAKIGLNSQYKSLPKTTFIRKEYFTTSFHTKETSDCHIDWTFRIGSVLQMYVRSHNFLCGSAKFCSEVLSWKYGKIRILPLKCQLQI